MRYSRSRMIALPNSDTTLDPLLSRADTAKLLQIHPKTLPRWERAGRIRPLRLTGRIIRYRRSEVERVLAQAETSVGEEAAV